MLKGVIEDGFTHSLWEDPESDEICLRESASITLFDCKLGQISLQSLGKLLDSGIVRKLHGQFRQFSNAFLFDIFKKIVPKRDKIDILIVQLNFLSVGCIHYPSLDFDCIISFQDFPGFLIDKLVVLVFSQLRFQLDIQVRQLLRQIQRAIIEAFNNVLIETRQSTTSEELIQSSITL